MKATAAGHKWSVRHRSQCARVLAVYVGAAVAHLAGLCGGWRLFFTLKTSAMAGPRWSGPLRPEGEEGGK